MRTTVTLDDNIYELASHYAAANGITLGAAIGELIERGQQKSSQPAQTEIRRAPNGFPLLPRRGIVLTSQMVKEALEDDIE